MKSATSLPFWTTLLLVVLLSGATAWWCAFSSVAPYDDEGSLMFFIQRFNDGHALYDDVHSMYGPLYYAYQSIPHALTGAPVTHDSVRVISVIFWIAASMVLFLVVYRMTGSYACSLAAYFIGFRALIFMGYEHAHPQELCILLLLLVLLAASARRSVSTASFGILVACLALTKINLAIMVAAALAVVFSLARPRGSLLRVLAPAAAIGALALPFLLMSAHLTQAWAIRYELLVFLSLLAAILAAATNRIGPFSARHLASGVLLGLVTTGIIASFVLMRGSTVAGMIQGLILWPRAHIAGSFSLPLRVRTAALIWAAVGLSLAWLASRGRLPQAWIAVLKLTLGGLVAYFIASRQHIDLINAATPLLWLAAITPASQTDRGDLVRPLLAVLAVIQVLYAYPVAGLQTGFVTVLMVVAAAVCVSDALPWLTALLPAWGSRIAPAATAATATLVIVASTYSAYRAFSLYQSREPLGLPGAERMRVKPELANSLRRIQAAVQPCSMLVSLPGLLSFNLFSGKPVPSGIVRAGLPAPWMLFMGDSEQAGVVRELAAQPHPCAIYDPEVSTMWTPGNQPPARPLVLYIKEDFRTEFETGGYRFMVRRQEP